MKIISIISIILLLFLIISGTILTIGLLPLSYAKETERVNPVSEIIKTAPDNPPQYSDAELEKLREGDFYVDVNNGNDDNDGKTINTAFASIERAKSAVREMIAADNNIDKDIEIVIRQGVYAIDKSIVFESEDCMAGNEVIYRNYPGEYPIIEGYASLKGFREYKDGIFVADIPQGTDFRCLVEDGKQTIVARYPDDGYLQVNKHTGSPEEECNSFGYKKDDVINSIQQETNAECVIFPGGEYGEWNWFSHIYPITGIDKSKRIITLDRKAYSDNVYCLGKGSRYFLQNALVFLNKEGEFYVDKKESKVYYKPYNQDNLDNGIKYACVDDLIKLNGVENISFKGLILRGTDIGEYASNSDAGISVENSNNVKVQDCLIYQTGKFGILGKYGNSNIRIEGCEIYNIGHTGIQIDGDGTINNNTDHVIRNNYIHHTGINIRHGAGIQLYHAQNCKIINNTVAYTPRYSISLKGSVEPLNDQHVLARYDRGEYVDEMPSRNNLIAYNDCSYANYDTQDTGAIEMWGAGYDNKIYNNIVHDCTVYFSFGYGIYVDDYNVRTTIENNLIYNLRARTLDDDYYGSMSKGEVMTGIFVKYQGNVIRNNIVANSDTTAAYFACDYDGNFGVEKLSDTVFENNISYNAYNPQKMVAFLRQYSNVMLELRKSNSLKGTNQYYTSTYIKRSDNNVMWVDNEPKVKWGKNYMMNVSGFGKRSFEEWIKNSGYDKNSIIADPMFRNVSEGDYTFMEGSPAKKLGINQIEISDVGCNTIW